MTDEKKIVSIDDILLDAKNPRFGSTDIAKNDNISQKDIISRLFRYFDIVTLANDINSADGLHTPEIIVCFKNDNGKYIVLEGNRRTSACKSLLDRNLIPNEYAKNFPFVKDVTKSNIEKISIVVYPDRRSADKYLISRHVKGNEKWSALEKNAYYMTLFLEYNKDIKKLIEITREKKTDLINIITKYQLFMDIYNILKSNNNALDITKIDYLPMTDVMMPIIVGENHTVGLNLKKDDEYKYICPEDKKEIYNDILILIGEAFLVRKEKKYCKNEEMSRVVSTNLKNKGKLEKLITDDIEIKGLYDLIRQFKGIGDNILQEQKVETKSKEILSEDEIVDKDIEAESELSEVKTELSGTISSEDLVYIPVLETIKGIPYSDTIYKLHKQINTLFNDKDRTGKSKYLEVIACSMRSIFEISIYELENNSNTISIFSNFSSNKLEERINHLIQYLSNKNAIITELEKKIDKGYSDIKNILKLNDFEKVISATHLGAHKSSTDLTVVAIMDMGKRAGLFIYIANELLNNENITL